MNYAYYNGRFSRYEDTVIPLTDRALFFGDGVYDAAVGTGGGIYRFHEHYERLARGAKAVGLNFRLSEGELLEILLELIGLSGLQSYFLYFHLSAAGEIRKHERNFLTATNLLATVKPWSMPTGAEAISVNTEEDIRHRLCNIKTLNLLPAVLASSRAVKSGCGECVFIKDGYVTECAHSNIFAVKNGRLITPRAGRSVLSGITRRAIIKIAKSHGIDTRIGGLTRDELLSADEAFVSSTSRICTRIDRINGCKIGEKSVIFYQIFQLLSKDYIEEIQN